MLSTCQLDTRCFTDIAKISIRFSGSQGLIRSHPSTFHSSPAEDLLAGRTTKNFVNGSKIVSKAVVREMYVRGQSCKKTTQQVRLTCTCGLRLSLVDARDVECLPEVVRPLIIICVPAGKLFYFTLALGRVFLRPTGYRASD